MAGTSLQTPIASFNSNVTSGNTPLNVLFTETSTGSPTAWNWNFGDGTINSALQNQTHTYSIARNYTVVLTASNVAGSNTVIGTVYVSWNKKDKGIAWNNAGGDWYDKNGVLQSSTPYATITIKGSSLPDNRYYELDATDLVKEYTSGKYENIGFLIKARTESNNYIAFYNSDCGNENQMPKLQFVYS